MSDATNFMQNAGGSLISWNAAERVAPIAWAFREPGMNPVDNGWRFLSAADDAEYLVDPDNLTVVDVTTVVAIEPAVLPLLHLPVGSDISVGRGPEGQVVLVDNHTKQPLDIPAPSED